MMGFHFRRSDRRLIGRFAGYCLYCRDYAGRSIRATHRSASLRLAGKPDLPKPPGQLAPRASSNKIWSGPITGRLIVAAPVILQIQEAALDTKASLTEALLKAKVACAKLGLVEFGNWVDAELNGYVDIPAKDMPEYRKLFGRPEAYNPVRGWQPIMFEDAKTEKAFSFAPVGMSVAAIENLLGGAKAGGTFEFPYPAEMAKRIRQAIKFNTQVHIELSGPVISSVLHGVRKMLLDWTLEMEKQNILGTDLTFNEDEKRKSVAVTEGVVNNITIGQVGSFVQGGDRAVVTGQVVSTNTLVQGVRDLVGQVDQLLPTSGFPTSVADETRAALSELKEASEEAEPEPGRLQRGLHALKKVLAPAGEKLLSMAVDSAVNKLLGAP